MFNKDNAAMTDKEFSIRLDELRTEIKSFWEANGIEHITPDDINAYMFLSIQHQITRDKYGDKPFDYDSEEKEQTTSVTKDKVETKPETDTKETKVSSAPKKHVVVIKQK